MSDEAKNAIIQELNVKIGDDISDLSNAELIEHELNLKRNALQSSLNLVTYEVPKKLSEAIKKAKDDSEDLELIKAKNKRYKEKVRLFLEKWQPLNSTCHKGFSAAEKLGEVLEYLKTFEKMHNISKEMKQCTDNEQLVQLYIEIREQCLIHAHGYQASYMRDISHYWHKIIRDKLTGYYEEILKQLQWPFRATGENTASKEVMAKFTSLTKCLMLIYEPDDILKVQIPGEDDKNPCLPVKLLLRPLRRRFSFHFTGCRQTARIDRPEWFLTQTLIWIRDHQDFVRDHVQPVADQLQLKYIHAVDEFNEGLIQLAAERLYSVLSLYEEEDEIEDVEAAFAHAVDETLGFHRELIAATEKENNDVLAVLTKANIFIQWLAVEKKYALSKLEEMLDNEQWVEPVAGGAAGAGAGAWVPRGADLFIALLRTIEDRYKLLPQPGHRLQFLELQLELVEEWRIRLTQILSASVASLTSSSFMDGAAPHPLTATINAAHHTTTVLLHLTHSLHYLQLHYYRRQFQHFTQQQHREEDEGASVAGSMEVVEEERKAKEVEIEETMSLKEVEIRARKLALNEVSRQASYVTDDEATKNEAFSPIASVVLYDDQYEESTVFGEAPSLLAHLRDAGLSALAEHIILEFKATLKEYKKLKWHSMPVLPDSQLCISAALCAPLSGVCARMSCAGSKLAPPLAAKLRAKIAASLDTYMLQEVILESWFNAGGIIQFTHDVKRNLVPAFAPPNKTASQLNQLPRLLEACKLLNMDFDKARRLRAKLNKNLESGLEDLLALGIKHILPQDVSVILSQRTDLSQTSEPASVLELF